MARKEGTVMESETTTTVTENAGPAPEKRARSTQRYTRTDKANTKDMRGQSKETLDALDANKGTAMTAAEIAALCKYEGTRQDKERVAAFYLAQFKKDGLVTVVAAQPAVAETASV